MSLKEKTIEELEQMSYTDIAYEIIKEKGKKFNTPNLFKEVCKLLKLSDAEFEEKIGDFFTALTTDGRFILINSTYWDLKENHKANIVVDDEEDETEDVEKSEEDEDDVVSDDLEDDYSDEATDDSDNDEDDFNDLTIIDEEDLDE
ncbi:MAG: DNA-directed RNA polymerase subunit delta [Bacilli bacterium]|nr:DNA-directed RNA polymerase subunit delta [Bacilli bacterium]